MGLEHLRDYRWKDLCIKDKIQYVMAILLVVAGVVIAFLSFFLNAFNIATGTLIFIAQCFITAGGIFGVSVYFKSKIGEFSSNATDKIEKMIEKALKNSREE
ncbi:MAG: hypothetical protein K2M55_07175 [Muribaculaceae bacterium]|nr:hypothetical protein [Muribaculaceae bacterium]